MATPKAQQQRGKESPATPLSPSVASRKDEKDQMINLNNRLAVYVEKVRSLETENSRLQIQITSYEQTSSREVSNMKAMYESELSEARRLLDELSKEKAQLQLEASSYREKYEAEKARANGLAHDNEVLEGKIKDLASLLAARDTQYNRTKKERDEFCSEIDNLKAKLVDLQNELDNAQRMLDNETLQRVDFENKLQSVKEEMLFKERLYNEEISEVRKRHTVSLTEIDKQVKGDYENKLEGAIIDLREQQTSDLEQLKEDLELQYSVKISDLTKRLDLAGKSNLKTQEWHRSSEMKLERLQNTIKSLQDQNNNLNNRVQDLEGQVETEREMRVSAVLAVEKQRDEARETLKLMEKDYNELLDLKIQLDQEISVYRKLLEEEEQRLNLSPGSRADGRGGRTRRKRKRVVAQLAGEESGAKRKDLTTKSTTTTYSSETVTVQKSQSQGRKAISSQQTTQVDPHPEGNNSCKIM